MKTVEGMTMRLLDHRPRGVVRALFRAPILLYRARLGRVLGHRFVYLTTQGRKSGLRRETVLEVVRYDRATPEVFVVAGWGPDSDWFRNIEANPALEVRIGGATWDRPVHRVLHNDEVNVLLKTYQGRHPRTWKRLAPMLGFPADPADPHWPHAVMRTLSVAFRPSGSGPGTASRAG